LDIKIYFKDGTCRIIDSNLWNDYEYINGMFVVKYDGIWFGIYNMDCIMSIEMYPDAVMKG